MAVRPKPPVDPNDPLAGLTVKQRRFVEAYTGPARGNATEAASQAGYKGTRSTLEVVGHENLRKPKIAAAVAKYFTAARAQAEMDGRAIRLFLGDCVNDRLSDGRDVKVGESIQAATVLARMQGAFLDLSAHLTFLLSLRSILGDEEVERIAAAIEAHAAGEA